MAVLENKNIFTRDSAKKLNQELKAFCADAYKSFLNDEIIDTYYNQGLIIVPEGKDDVAFALSCLWIKHKISKSTYEFPVFFSLGKGWGLQKAKNSLVLHLNFKFKRLYDNSVALEKILKILSEKGLSTWVEENNFFLGFHDYSNLVFTSRGYKVAKEPLLRPEVL